MPSLSRDGRLLNEDWELADAEQAAPGNALIPLAALASLGPAKVGGVYLKSTDDVRALAPFLAQIQRVAVVFDVFMDGRGFSQARILRDELGYTGELAACGHYIQDQLLYLKRCGFDRFQLPAEFDLESWRVSLNDFSEYYQAACDEPLPLFRRRALRLA